MTWKNHLCRGLLCIGLALAICSPTWAGWGSYGGSYGSGGSWGGSVGSGASLGSGGSFGGGLFHRHKVGGSFGSTGSSYGSIFSGSAGSHGSSGGAITTASFGSSGDSSGGDSSGGSFGSSGGLFHGGLISRLRAHHQQKMAWLRSHSHGSSGGSSGGSNAGGSSGGSSGGHTTYSVPAASHGSHGGSAGGYSFSSSIATASLASTTPVTHSLAGDNTTTDVAPAVAGSDDGSLIVKLPADAKLFVNGQQTTSTGDTRSFVSKGLKSGYRYPYEVKAIMDVAGREVVRAKKVELRAGDKLELAFDFSAATTTKLTVRVPETATVELAGTQTKSKGTERSFSTNKLTAGDVWDGYQVVVTSEGVTKTQTISLRAGENRTLTFDFDVQEMASR